MRFDKLFRHVLNFLKGLLEDLVGTDKTIEDIFVGLTNYMSTEIFPEDWRIRCVLDKLSTNHYDVYLVSLRKKILIEDEEGYHIGRMPISKTSKDEVVLGSMKLVEIR